MAQTISRRKLLAAAATASPILATPLTCLAFGERPRELGFFHTHTGQKLRLIYWENGQYLADAMTAIDRLLRDFRTGDIHPIDPGVIDILHATQIAIGRGTRFEIISAYRSPITNSLLAANSTGVAKRSLHMQGRALDIRLQGVATDTLRDAAMSLRAGGVGYYHQSDFIHVDTGRVRTW